MFKWMKMTAGVLFLTMIFTILPICSVQADGVGQYYYKYEYTVTTADCKSAGTREGQLYSILYFYDKNGKTSINNSLTVNLTGAGVKDKGKDATMKTGYTTYEPWCLAKVVLSNRCDEAYRAWRFSRVKVDVYEKVKEDNVEKYVYRDTRTFNFKGGKSEYYPNGKKSNQGKWIDDGDEHATKITLPIDLQGNGVQTMAPETIKGWSDFSKNVYLDVDTTSGTESKSVTGGLSSGPYSKINFWKGEFSSPKMTFSASGSAAKGTDATWDTLVDENAITVTKTNGKVSGYTINKKEMASYMNKNAINAINIKTTLKFNWWAMSDRNLKESGMTNHGGDKYSRSCTIYRKAIEVESVTMKSGEPKWNSSQMFSKNSVGKEVLNYSGVTTHASNTLFKHFNDNFYYNSKTESIAVTVKFKKTNTYGHLEADFWNKNYPSSVPKLRIGDDKNYVYLEMDEIKTKENGWKNLSESQRKQQTVNPNSGEITYFYRLDGKKIDSNGNGIMLVFDDFNIGGYKLTKQQTDYTKSGNTAGDMEYLQSAYKVDTIMPEITTELSDETTEINGWRKKAVVKYTPSEDLHNYVYTSSDFSVNKKFNFLYFGDNVIPQLVGISNNKLFLASDMAAENYTASLNLELAEETEIDGGVQVLDTRDVAGNRLNKRLATVKLDNLAPRVNVKQQETYEKNDGSKSMKVDFELQDASKSGKVYYTFSKDATPPEFNSAEEAGAQTMIIESLFGKWAFLNQQPDSKSKRETYDPTNGSAIIKLLKGQNFSGYLYYFTEDGFGNKSPTQSLEINIENPEVKCVITATNEDISKPLKNYEIDIVATEGDVFYKWKHPYEEGYISSYKRYTSASETGKGIQTDNNGNEIVMDGECTLQVMVRIGNTETNFEKKFVFDNSSPSIRFINLAQGSFKKAHTIEISADDPSGIESAEAKLITSDGTEVQDIQIALENEILNTDVTISDVDAGAYKIRAIVTDKNGDVTERESNVFYIRNEAPNTTVSVLTEKTLGDEPLLSNESYTVNIEAFESFVNSVGEQHLYYRFSEDTNKWGAWTMSENAMTAESDGHRISFEVTPPDIISEGTNLIHLQTVVAPFGVNPINLEDITTTNNITIVLDTTAPTPRLDLTDMHTNTPITGILYLDDMVSNEFVVDKGDISDSLMTIEVVKDEEGQAISGQYQITVKDNLNTVIYASDYAGNKVEIPVKIEGFDFEAPSITNEEPVMTQKGSRTDSAVKVTISGALKGSEQFALIPESDYQNALSEDGKIKDKYFTDYSEEDKAVLFDEDYTVFDAVLAGEKLSENQVESVLTYDISLNGISGTYYVGIRAEDSIGNSKDVILNVPLSPVDAEITLLENVTASPKLANKKARVLANFNVPVYIMPQNMITATSDDDLTLEETNLKKAVTNATGYTQQQSFIIEKTGTYKMYVADELGRSKVFEAVVTDDMVTFGNTDVINAETVVLYGPLGQGWDCLDFDPTLEGAYRIVSGTEMVTPGDSQSEDSTYGTFTAVEVTAPQGVYLLPADDSITWDEKEGLLVWDYMNNQYVADVNAPEKGYTKLYYLTSEIRDSITELPVDRNERSVNIKYRTDADPEGVWTEHIVTVGNIDNTPPQMVMTLLPETIRDENRKPTLYTLGDVVAEITISDPHTGVKEIGIDAYDVQTDTIITDYATFDISKIDPSGVIEDNEYYKMSISGEYDENGNDLNPKGIKTVTIIFKKNMRVNFGAVNTVGGWETVHNGDGESLEIDYINKIDISESDYTVEYFYEDYQGMWQPVTEGVYYKKAKAVVTPTQSGNERGLFVSNNNESGEKILTEFDYQFTFLLNDQYGYEVEIPVILDNFDNEPGKIEYSLSTLEKTNKPVTITVTASDELSGVGSVTLERKSSGTSEAIPLVDNSDGTYSGQITNTGSYTITMLDNVGNKAQKSFVATNIDSTPPKITDIKWNVESGKKTSGSLVAEITYSKPGVSLTKVTSSTDIKSKDYIADKTASVIRFFENGTVNVWFTDEYGNVGEDIVTADQIYRNPPALEAVATLSQDEQNVDISFKKAVNAQTGVPIDTYRELKDVMVKYHGIVNRADEAVFSFSENGKYTFEVYDDEGISSNITVEISNIDKTMPEITQVRWSYDYDVLENGEWVTKQEDASWTVGTEEGYLIATDKFNVTNKDVFVTVTTDADTKITGDSNSVFSKEHTMNYFENGMYVFNTEKKNGMFDSYGFQVEIIDKTPPVIEIFTPEIIFYENPDANEQPYSKDMIAKAGVAFRAYDLFGGEKDLSDKVEIDFGEFNADDISQNVFDRTKPYTIKYKVSDDAHNITETTMTVRLIGYNDSIAIVNNKLPDYGGRVRFTDEENINIKLGNFSGKAYARVKKGVYTMGEMKKSGTILKETETGDYSFKPDESNYWYTFLIQTDKRDYFNIQVFFK